MAAKSRDLPEVPASKPNLHVKLIELESVRHSVGKLGLAHAGRKAEQIAYFVERALAKGLTAAMVDENLTAGRPALFVEGPNPAEHRDVEHRLNLIKAKALKG